MSDFNMPPGVPARDIPGNNNAWREEGDIQAHAVMTLRDFFAGAAMPALVSAVSSGQHKPQLGDTPQDGISIDAYALADAMLKARAQ